MSQDTPTQIDLSAAIAQVWALQDECSVANWNGEGAQPISTAAAQTACDLMRALPGDVPFPEPAPEPDGSISLDWIESRNRLFTLSVGAGGRLPYAWVDGSPRGHGVARCEGDGIPSEVLDRVRRLTAMRRLPPDAHSEGGV